MSVLYLEPTVVEGIGEEQIKKLSKKMVSDMRYSLLDGYYRGEHEILKHQAKDSTLPNNKIVNNMAKYITDTAVGYFIGKPVVYGSANAEFMEKLQDIFNYNDEQDHNSELAKKASICGHCFEMLYVDEEGRIRFGLVEPGSLLMIYQNGYSTPLAAVRILKSVNIDGKESRKIEYWDWNSVWYFDEINGGGLKLVDSQEHYWDDIPFVEYINNEERRGDFEDIMTQNDAYNTVQSNTANMFQYNDEAILTIEGLGEVSSEDVRDMKEKGAIILENSGKIAWLMKQIDDSALENYKKRIYQDMHQFSSVPNLADESFGNNIAGVAMDYKLWGLDQKCVMKERKFKRGLQRRIELIARMLNVLGGNYDYRDIDIQFRRNKPQNLLELATIFNNLASGVSKETRLKLLPFIESVNDELQKQQEEEKAAMEDFGNYEMLATSLEQMKLGQEEDGALTVEGTEEAPALPPVLEGEEAIAKVSLNGAQIQSLLSIVQAVIAGTLDYTAAVTLITASFPFDVDTAKNILGDENALKEKAKKEAKLIEQGSKAQVD